MLESFPKPAERKHVALSDVTCLFDRDGAIMGEKKVMVFYQYSQLCPHCETLPGCMSCSWQEKSLQLVISLISTPSIIEGGLISEITCVKIGLNAALQTLSCIGFIRRDHFLQSLGRAALFV